MNDKPRCPLRTAGFDQPDTCDPRCMWLMQDANDALQSACAIAVIAQNTGKQMCEADLNGWVIANEVD